MLVCLSYFQNFLSISYEYQYMLIISSAWIYMRGQSYCLDKLLSADTGPSVSDLVMMLGYCFYFPMLFLGPLVLYQEFEAGLLKPYAPWTLQRVKTFVLYILRYLWWMLFLELFLHYVYIGALQKEVQVGWNEQFLTVTESGIAEFEVSLEVNIVLSYDGFLCCDTVCSYLPLPTLDAFPLWLLNLELLLLS